MTLIVSLANKDQVIQISDRRTSWNNEPKSEETNKAGALFCPDGIMAFGFTGLASYGDFNTQRWLLESLTKAAPPEYKIGTILEKLKGNASETFKEHPSLKGLPRERKRLTILFSGYIDYKGKIIPAFSGISNFEDILGNLQLEPFDEFKAFYSGIIDNSNGIFVVSVGSAKLKEEDSKAICGLLSEGKPKIAIIEKTLKTIRKISDNSQTIGKQISSITIPFASPTSVEAAYHTSKNSYTHYTPSSVYVSPTRATAVYECSISVDPKYSPPIQVPKIGKNHPCICGSGKKFKRCCMGKNNDFSIQMGFGIDLPFDKN